MSHPEALVRWLSELSNADIADVGGKNASLGEMVCELSRVGIAVPDGFATTSAAYRSFLATNGLAQPIREQLARLAERVELHPGDRPGGSQAR